MTRKKKKDVITQNRLLSIDVFEQTIVATVHGQKGERVVRVVEPGDVIGMFAAGGQDTRWLNLSDRIVAIGLGGNGSLRALVIRKPSRKIITVQIGKRRHRVKMSIPALLAQISTQAGQWSNIERVWAYKGTLNASTPLYVAPFPNCYPDATVCMGNVQIPEKLPPEKAFEAGFIDSLFSDHVLSGPLKNTKRWRNIWAAIQQTKGRVPISELKKVTTYGKILKTEKTGR